MSFQCCNQSLMIIYAHLIYFSYGFFYYFFPQNLYGRFLRDYLTNFKDFFRNDWYISEDCYLLRFLKNSLPVATQSPFSDLLCPFLCKQVLNNYIHILIIHVEQKLFSFKQSLISTQKVGHILRNQGVRGPKHVYFCTFIA